jgi:hypothetical protein
VQRASGLAKRQVECGAVKCPAPIETRDLSGGRIREQVELVHPGAELIKRIAAGQIVDGAGLLEGDVVLRVVDNVLADARAAASVEVNHGR